MHASRFGIVVLLFGALPWLLHLGTPGGSPAYGGPPPGTADDLALVSAKLEEINARLEDLLARARSATGISAEELNQEVLGLIQKTKHELLDLLPPVLGVPFKAWFTALQGMIGALTEANKRLDSPGGVPLALGLLEAVHDLKYGLERSLEQASQASQTPCPGGPAVVVVEPGFTQAETGGLIGLIQRLLQQGHCVTVTWNEATPAGFVYQALGTTFQTGPTFNIVKKLDMGTMSPDVSVFRVGEPSAAPRRPATPEPSLVPSVFKDAAFTTRLNAARQPTDRNPTVTHDQANLTTWVSLEDVCGPTNYSWEVYSPLGYPWETVSSSVDPTKHTTACLNNFYGIQDMPLPTGWFRIPGEWWGELHVNGVHSATARFTVPPLSQQAPVAVDDFVYILTDPSEPAGTPNHVFAKWGVLANDFDPNGDPLTARPVVLPEHGSLDFKPDGSFDYTPDPGFVGTDSFKYVVDDGRGGMTEATCTLDVSAIRPPDV